ncbi:TonB-dependent receptor [Echinicola soli]|uniref:TonB-dependent receptor n=2 Tax=Echinicola soli TaxID=2591634 RepID=A0A514CNX0_9BACT|nr:TonB-dependent receptor [Echinicola soli]
MSDVLKAIALQSDINFLRINDNIHVTAAGNKNKSSERSTHETVLEQVTGTITDQDGQPIPGVTIRVKETLRGTVTDIDGKFKIEVAEGETLTFSFVGFLQQELVYSGQQSLSIELKQDLHALDEVVVIGYGTTKRSDLTGAVSSVDMEELKDIPVVSPLQAIAGRIAGVNVTITEGSPDAEMKVRIRGGGSITQDNSPLYIVDGFQVSSINDIPPADIKTIDVLKDASATAIYGAQGANGVILVTTKSGKIGKTEVTFNSYVGMREVYNLTDVLSPYEYVHYQKELDPGPSVTGTSFYGMYGLWDDVDIYKSKGGNDWQKQLYGNTGVQKHFDVGLSGGNESLQYLVNYTRDDENYIMLNSAYKRDNISIKINKQISDRLKVDLYSRMSNTTITGPSVSSGRMLRDGVKYAPVRSLTYIPESSLAGTEDINSAEALSSLNDPIYNITNEYKKQYRFNNIYNLGVTWDIVEGLTFRTRGTYSFSKDYTDNIWLKNTGEASANGGQPVARRTDQKGQRWSIQNTLNYDFSTQDGKHEFNFLIGQEVYNTQRNSMRSESKFFPGDFNANNVLAMWNYGTPLPTYTDIGEPSRTSSFFGRFNYLLSDKYIFTFTAREDGKNVFAPGNRWGFFPAGAFAWKISEERFLKGKLDWLSNAKLRVSYGEVGNARVGSYWRQQYSFQSGDNRLIYIGETAQSALQPSSVLKNENLTWETKVSSNIGLDMALFNNRLNLTIDIYRDVTRDLILAVVLPANSGYSSQYQNVGSTSNKGIEISATGYIIDRGDFQLSANFNIAFNRNKIEQLDGSDYLIASSGWGLDLGSDDFRAQVGEPIGQIYGFVGDGMYSFDDFTFDETQKKWIIKEGVADVSSVITTSGNYFGPGHIKVKKLSGEGSQISADEDRTVIGNTMPKHTGGFTLNAVLKGFDLSAMLNWSYGNDIYNANKVDYTTFTGAKRYQNLSSLMSLDNRFTTIDPVTGYNVMFGNEADPERLQVLNQDATLWHPITNRSILTEWAVEDGSFLRLNTLTLGYTLPESLTTKFLVQNLRIYFSGYNLAIWTNYSGQDPEVDTRRSTPLTPGVDYSAYPKARTFLAGVNITF